MRRDGSPWAFFAALVAIGATAGCGDARPAAAPPAGQTGCSSCHSGPGEAPPFRDPTGSTDTSRITVGAHDPHFHGDLAARFSCAECHTTPDAVGDPGHLDDSPGDLRFGTLARTGGAEPTYAAPPGAPSPTCSAVYCHGNFPGGNTDNVPRWITSEEHAECGSCHDLPPPTGRHQEHDGKVNCATCHGPVVAETHVNGIRNVVLTNWDAQFRTCAQACHQARSWGQ